MARYIAVLVPRNGGSEWSAHLPDFVGCRATAVCAETAIQCAAQNALELARSIRAEGRSLPKPRNLIEIRADPSWAEERQLEWPKAVVAMVEVRG